MRGKYILFIVSVFLLSLMSALVLGQDKEANVSISVEKMSEETSPFTVVILAVVFVALLVIAIYLLKYINLQQKKNRALREKAELDIDKSDLDEEKYKDDHEEEVADLSMDTEVDKYLKEDERNIVNILRKRGGVCSQATLRIAGNFSKATLSRILKELEERNIIKKEKRGKKNLVILK